MTILVYILTAPTTVRAFLTGQVGFLQSHGFDVNIISSPSAELDEFAQHEGVQVHITPIDREISLANDVRSLVHIYQLLRIIQPDIVNAGTPKAGLLGMLAAKMTCTPVRIYQLRGLRLETLAGIKRSVLAVTERMASYSAHYVVCNSQSLLEQYAQLRLAPRRKLRVLGPGSSNGVNPAKFADTPSMLDITASLRQKLALADSAIVIGFVGRLTRDKGISELIDAFLHINVTCPQTQLVLVGGFEAGDPLPLVTVETIKQHPAIRCTGFVVDTAPYYRLLDILAFPSYREGFPNVVLEAALSAVPAVGFRTTGVVDAILHNQTGLLTPLGSTQAFADAVMTLVAEPVLRSQLGQAARQRALQEFKPEDIWRRWADFYDACLAKRT